MTSTATGSLDFSETRVWISAFFQPSGVILGSMTSRYLNSFALSEGHVPLVNVRWHYMVSGSCIK